MVESSKGEELSPQEIIELIVAFFRGHCERLFASYSDPKETLGVHYLKCFEVETNPFFKEYLEKVGKLKEEFSRTSRLPTDKRIFFDKILTLQFKTFLGYNQSTDKNNFRYFFEPANSFLLNYARNILNIPKLYHKIVQKLEFTISTKKQAKQERVAVKLGIRELEKIIAREFEEEMNGITGANKWFSGLEKITYSDFKNFEPNTSLHGKDNLITKFNDIWADVRSIVFHLPNSRFYADLQYIERNFKSEEFRDILGYNLSRVFDHYSGFVSCSVPELVYDVINRSEFTRKLLGVFVPKDYSACRKIIPGKNTEWDSSPVESSSFGSLNIPETTGKIPLGETSFSPFPDKLKRTLEDPDDFPVPDTTKKERGI